MAGFDWYQATIPDENVYNVLEALGGLSDAPKLRHSRGAHGYAHTTVVEDASGPLARVWHGGTHMYPHVVLSGENTQAGVELIVLSGYLRRLGPLILGAYRNRILNIHPGLLPTFGGEGMYGRRVHEAVIAAGASESGATIHAVDDIYDHGPVIARRTVPVLPGDTPDSLEARVTAMEPGFFVETLQAIAEGRQPLPA